MKTGYKYLWLLVPWVEAAMKTFAIMIDQQNSDQTASNQFESLAMSGCQKAVSETLPTSSTKFQCKWIFAPPASYTSSPTTWLISQISSDPTIIHGYMMGFYYADLLIPIASHFPNISFSFNDAAIDPTSLPNIQGIVFQEDEAGFLAGVTAGSITQTNIVAVVGNYPIPPIQRYMQGYLKGVKYMNPAARVVGRYHADPTWGNVTFGREIAGEYLGVGADVMFNSAGGLGSAAIYYAASRGVWVIGVDADESKSTFQNKSEVAAQWIFNSALKRVDVAAFDVVRDKMEGVFFNGNKVMEISNGGIGVSNCSSPLACTIASSQITFVDPKTSGMCATPVKTSITNLINTAAMRLQVNAFSTGVANGFYQGLQQTSDHSWIEYPTFGITPGGLQGHSITMIDSQNKFLVYGGQMVSGALSSTLYLFEFDAIQWSVVQPSSAIQPPPLINHAAIFCNATQELVLFGGSTSINSLNNAIWKFNIKTNLWTQVLVVDYSPGFRTLQAFDGVDGKLYVWGGQDSTRNVKGDLWQFNILTSQWQQYSLNSVTPSGKYGSVMRIVNNTNLLLFGGNNGQTDTNELWSFDINLQTWTQLNPYSTNGFTPPPLTNPAVAVIDPRRILYSGGLSNKIPQSINFIYNSGTNEWTTSPNYNFPVASQGIVLTAFNQSNSPSACVFELDTVYQQCTPISNEIIVFAYGGARPGTGISDTTQLLFVAREVLPPAPMDIPVGISITGYTISGVGLCFVITMSIVLVLNSKRPAFRFASVTFLSIYLVGAGLGFMGLVFYNIGTNSLAMCTVSLWFVSVGTFMIYSAMVVKNVRIYVIFLGTQMGSWTSDGTLLVAVLLLNLANGAILVAFQIATPYEQSVYITDGEVWPICASPQSSSWQWILLSPFLVLILLGLFLSIQTRDVKSEFNESGLINRSIYITTLTLSVLIPLNMTLKLPSTIRSITTLIISLTLFTVIGMNFIPKIMATTENQSRIKEFVSEERRKTSSRNSSIIKSTSSKV